MESVAFSGNLRVQSRLLATDQESRRGKRRDVLPSRATGRDDSCVVSYRVFVLSRHRRTTACDPKEDGASGGSTLPNHADVLLLILGCPPA